MQPHVSYVPPPARTALCLPPVPPGHPVCTPYPQAMPHATNPVGLLLWPFLGEREESSWGCLPACPPPPPALHWLLAAELGMGCGRKRHKGISPPPNQHRLSGSHTALMLPLQVGG